MEKYRKAIMDMVKKLHDEKSLKRIYNLVMYIYIHES